MRPGLTPVAVIVSCAALATGLTFVVAAGGSTAAPAPEAPVTVVVLPTRSPDLSSADIARYAGALGIRGSPERNAASWTATDPERSIVLQRGPKSWYVLYTDSSVLLEPPAPGTGLPSASSEPAPSPGDALDAARSVLTRAGALTGEWQSRIGAAAAMPAFCRPLPTPYNCTEIRMRTRHVVFTRAVKGRPTTVEWEVLVGPGSRILDAVGRIAILERPPD